VLLHVLHRPIHGLEHLQAHQLIFSRLNITAQGGEQGNDQKQEDRNQCATQKQEFGPVAQPIHQTQRWQKDKAHKQPRSDN
jgi:hypothetical protein